MWLVLAIVYVPQVAREMGSEARGRKEGEGRGRFGPAADLWASCCRGCRRGEPKRVNATQGNSSSGGGGGKVAGYRGGGVQAPLVKRALVHIMDGSSLAWDHWGKGGVHGAGARPHHAPSAWLACAHRPPRACAHAAREESAHSCLGVVAVQVGRLLHIVGAGGMPGPVVRGVCLAPGVGCPARPCLLPYQCTGWCCPLVHRVHPMHRADLLNVHCAVGAAAAVAAAHCLLRCCCLGAGQERNHSRCRCQCCAAALDLKMHVCHHVWLGEVHAGALRDARTRCARTTCWRICC